MRMSEELRPMPRIGGPSNRVETGSSVVITQTVTTVTRIWLSDMNGQSIELRLRMSIARNCRGDIDNDPIVQDKDSHCTWRPAGSGGTRGQPAETTRLRSVRLARWESIERDSRS